MKKNGKFAKRGIATKVMLVILAVMLVAGISVGSTLAWLSAQSNTLTNTFSDSNVKIKLDEAKIVDGEATNERIQTGGNEYKIIPGVKYTKDPTVYVLDETDIDCILFVKFEEENNPSTYFTYDSTLDDENSGWTQGNGTDVPANVWYRTVEADAAAAEKQWTLLADGITVKKTVETTDMTAAAAAKLTYTAYAVQAIGFEDDIAGAWTAAQGLEVAN